MVLQVFTHTGQLALDGYAVLLQQRGGADARQLQQLRRLNGAGTEQDFGVAARLF